MAFAATPHEVLGRARARLGVLRPGQRLARRALFKGMLFATFVVAVSLVGRAWALARLPRAEPVVAVSTGGDPIAAAAPFGPTAPASPAIPAVPATPGSPSSSDGGAPANGQGIAITAAATAPVEGTVSGEGVVNLNTATAADLETLPYVGPKRAQAILALRAKVGRFKSVDDLLKVKGIGRATLKRMRPKLTVGAG